MKSKRRSRKLVWSLVLGALGLAQALQAAAQVETRGTRNTPEFEIIEVTGGEDRTAITVLFNPRSPHLSVLATFEREGARGGALFEADGEVLAISWQTSFDPGVFLFDYLGLEARLDPGNLEETLGAPDWQSLREAFNAGGLAQRLRTLTRGVNPFAGASPVQAIKAASQGSRLQGTGRRSAPEAFWNDMMQCMIALGDFSIALPEAIENCKARSYSDCMYWLSALFDAAQRIERYCLNKP